MVQKTTNQFIMESMQKHKGVYNYAETVYKGSNQKVIVICNIHGRFTPRANDHLNKLSGCPKCANKQKIINNKKKYTTDWFINKATLQHNNKYDYAKTKYINNQTKVIVTCKTHGDFLTNSSEHLSGTGCPTCGNEQRIVAITKLTSKFITQSKNKHNCYYNYRYVDYINHDISVQIECPIHGLFYQKPRYHLQGCGCPKCGNAKCGAYDTETFIKKSTFVHDNKYKYCNTKYVHAHGAVSIICPNHGTFEQIAYYHLQGSGCPKCAKRYYSLIAIEWLEDIMKKEQINIQHACNDGEFKIPNTRFHADGFCEETNTVYEFYGDKWHGNLQIIDDNHQCHPFSNKTALELNTETIAREIKIRSLGFNLISIWEHDYYEKTRNPTKH